MDIFTFILAVVDKWAALMTGGIAIAALTLWERYKNQPISWASYFAIALISIFVACYQAWRDEHKMTQQLTQSLQNVSGGTDRVSFPFTYEQEQRFISALERVPEQQRFPVTIHCNDNAALYANKMASVFNNHGWSAKAACSFLIVSTSMGFGFGLSQDVFSYKKPAPFAVTKIMELLEYAHVKYARAAFDTGLVKDDNDYWFVVALPPVD
jgi:hypothetical protein